jgi:hypothetical protein
MKLIYSVIASVLSKVKDAPWWIEHLKQEEERKWASIRDDVVWDLPSDLAALIDNTITYKKQELEALNKEVDFKVINEELRMVAKIVRKMNKLRRIVGIQPMTTPCALIYKINKRDESLEVVRETVTAKTRKLSTHMNIEALADLNAMHEINAADEISRIISDQVFTEMLNEIISQMYQAASTQKEILIDGLESSIYEVSESIFSLTGRHQASFAICSTDAVRQLSTSPNFKAESGVSIGEMKHVGYLDKIAIFENKFSQNAVVVGAKGASDIDSGLIYSPYMPLMRSGPVVDPNTFMPLMIFMTRYGMTVNDGNFYGAIKISS